jgi:hemerythrin-like domain-containing protein
MPESRRAFLQASSTAALGFFVTACGRDASSSVASDASASPMSPSAKPAGDGGIEVTAVEDLMREHGVLRRCLVVYREVASKLRKAAESVSPDALQKTAKLFRTFGEQYHEQKLEEANIFPAMKRAGGPIGDLVDVLMAQHERGRAITDYVVATTQGPKIGAKAGELADVLDSFAQMYEAHAAREDTILFPAWKATMSPKDYDAIGDKFEDIERQQFGKDGFEDAVRQIAAIEAGLGLIDLTVFMAPLPPKP